MKIDIVQNYFRITYNIQIISYFILFFHEERYTEVKWKRIETINKMRRQIKMKRYKYLIGMDKLRDNL